MDIMQRVVEFDLPKDSYIVVGSGILGALGIRKAGDIDLIVSQEVYDRLEGQNGWSYGKWSDQTVLQQDVFDIGTDWYGESVHDLLQRAEYINDIPYMNLDDVYAWKKSRGQAKDVADLRLIDTYRRSLH